MTPDLEFDAYSDAVLISVLRYLVVRTTRAPNSIAHWEPHDGVLTFEGVETVEELIRQSQEIRPHLRFASEYRPVAASTYEAHRRVIDPLWRYIERYGVDALKEEATQRAHRGEQKECPGVHG